MEDLSDASFLGKLLVLPANVRLDWKVIARYKHSSLFGLVVYSKEKSFITLTPARGVEVGVVLRVGLTLHRVGRAHLANYGSFRQDDLQAEVLHLFMSNNAR